MTGIPLMADVDVSNRLDGIEKRVDKLDGLLIDVRDVLVSNGKLTERLINTNDNLNRVVSRVDKLDTRVTDNHSQIVKWSGGIVALLTCVGIVSMLVAIWSKLA